MKLLTRRVSLQSNHANFQKKFVSPNMAPFLIFEFFAKITKHKNTYISKTMLDRAISMNFFNHRVSLQSSHANFQNIFVSPKMAAILNFRIFRKICRTQNAYISKTVLDRGISMKFLSHRVSLQSSYPNFQKIFVSPKMAVILNFRIFRKNCKTHKCLYLENHAG